MAAKDLSNSPNAEPVDDWRGSAIKQIEGSAGKLNLTSDEQYALGWGREAVSDDWIKSKIASFDRRAVDNGNSGQLQKLFADKGGSSAYLKNLLSGAPGSESQDATATPAAASPAAASDLDLNTLEGMTAYAKQMGWADPNAFSVDMLENPDAAVGVHRGSGAGIDTPAYTRFKDEFAAARGMSGEYASGNIVNVLYGPTGTQKVTKGSGFWDDEHYTVDEDVIGKTGYSFKGGQVKDSKYPTAVNYKYDANGKYTGYELDTKTPWYVDAAPLISIGLMAAGVGGAFSGLGAAANTQLGLGLGTTGQAALGGGIVGGGVSALTGQNPIKGAAIGATGSAISAANPAGLAGIKNPALMGAVNGALSSGGKAVVAGGKVDEALLDGAVNGAFKGLSKK